MGKLTDNMYDFADNVTAIPGNVVGGISDITGAGKICLYLCLVYHQNFIMQSLTEEVLL